jgi:predicted kinase
MIPQVTDTDPTLTFTIGLPGAGKTRYATDWTQEAEPGARAKVSRDEIQRMLFPGMPYTTTIGHVIRSVQHSTVRRLLNAGASVIIDDTSLTPAAIQRIADDARLCGSVRLIAVDLTGVPYTTCVARDRARDRSIGVVGIDTVLTRWAASVLTAPERGDVVSDAAVGPDHGAAGAARRRFLGVVDSMVDVRIPVTQAP